MLFQAVMIFLSRSKFSLLRKWSIINKIDRDTTRWQIQEKLRRRAFCEGETSKFVLVFFRSEIQAAMLAMFV